MLCNLGAVDCTGPFTSGVPMGATVVGGLQRGRTRLPVCNGGTLFWRSLFWDRTLVSWACINRSTFLRSGVTLGAVRRA